MKYDLGIIGGGPGGYTAAEKASSKGLSVVLFEKNYMGGTCLNHGCIPTKALLHEATSGKDFNLIHEKKNEVVETLRKGVEGLMKSAKVTVVKGEAQVNGIGKIACNDEVYEVDNIIIATGAEPSIPPIKGSDIPGVYTSDDLLKGEGKNLQSLVIIGGGVIGVEIGTFYANVGTSVTILEVMDHILPQMTKEIAQRAAMTLKKKGVDVQAQVQIKGIAGAEGYLTVSYTDKKGEEHEVSCDGILMATGRRANAERVFAADFVRDFGLEFERGGISADEYGRTKVSGLYIIGDAKKGNIQLAHVAEADAINAVSVICGEEPIVDMKTVPSCIYTEPEIATVGLSDEEAKEKGIEFRTVKIPTGSNGKCLIEGADSGFIKLVLGEDDVILGAQLISPRATDIIGELALAVSHRMTVRDIASVIHPHPTISELVLEAARHSH